MGFEITLTERQGWGKRMNQRGAFGNTIAEHLGLGHAHSAKVISTGPSASFAVTRLICDESGFPRSRQISSEKALIIVLQLEPLLRHRLWFGNTPQSVEPWAKGTISMVDLERDPSAEVSSASDVLQLYLPRASLEAAAESDGARPIRELKIRGGTDDPVIYRLGQLMVPALQKPEEANVLFLTGLMTAMNVHLGQRYGDGWNGTLRDRVLTPAQLCKAKEMISADLPGRVTLAALASACHMSSREFSKAFQRSTGVAPHKWLLIRRVQHAKQMLQAGNFNLDEVAMQCGFANKHHLCRVFSALVGTSPNSWILTIATLKAGQRPI